MKKKVGFNAAVIDHEQVSDEESTGEKSSPAASQYEAVHAKAG